MKINEKGNNIRDKMANCTRVCTLQTTIGTCKFQLKELGRGSSEAGTRRVYEDGGHPKGLMSLHPL